MRKKCPVPGQSRTAAPRDRAGIGIALTPRIFKERPELVDAALPLPVSISVLPCREGEDFLRRLFEPLGYRLTAQRHPLDETFPEWGESAYRECVFGVLALESEPVDPRL